MKAYKDKILEKMRKPEFAHLNFDFAFKLTNESERGAVLISVSMVEEYLEKLTLAIFPTKQNSFVGKLLNYPGPLSSFAGKIELLYGFRIIDGRMYKSLTTLRKVRNTVAHSSHIFSLNEVKEKLELIYDFEDNIMEVVHKLAYHYLIKWKLLKTKDSFEKNNITEFDYKELWNERVPNPDEDEEIQSQLLVWKLAYGLTFLCTKLEIIIEEYSLLQVTDKIWIDYLDDLMKKAPSDHPDNAFPL